MNNTTSHWRRTSGSMIDHTFCSISAQSLFVKPISTMSSVLRSVQVTESDNVCALRFAYHHHPSNEGQLIVKIDNGLLRRLVSSTASWEVVVVPLRVVSSSFVYFVMRNGNSSLNSSAALDDLQFLPCTWCTFEFGMCFWTSLESSSNHTKWKRHFGSTPTPDTGPDKDNTLGNSKGHYIYVEGKGQPNETAVLRGQTFSYDNNICSLAFCYHMYGSDVGTLEVNVVSSDGNVTTKWTKSGNLSNQWNCVEIRVFEWSRGKRWRNVVMHVEFRADVVDGDIALDDIRYQRCADYDLCTFTKDTCFWHNAWDNKLQWQLESLSNTILGDSLVANVSYSNNTHIHMNSTGLEGPIVHASDHICSLRVCYSCDSLVASNLSLLQNQLDLGGNVSLLRVAHLPHRTQHTVEISQQCNRSSYVNVQADWGAETGTFRIHSLQYLRCHYTSFETSSRWRDQSASPNVTCSLVNTSHTDTQHMPADDHTYGSKQNGSYMLLGSETGDHVVVTTRDNVLWENVCGLRLWYYVLSGRPQLSFTVHKDSNKQVVLEHACNGFSKWHLAEMAVGYQLVGSKVMLDVSSADASRFKVAIDDVEFTECADFLFCSFERDLCLWRIADDLSTAATWIRWSGPYPTLKSTLKSDHTFGTPLGRYLLLLPDQQTSLSSSNSTAVLQGLPLSKESVVCGIEFWYHVTAAALVVLTVHLESESDKQIIWEYKRCDDGKVMWRKAWVTFSVSSASHVEFTASSSEYKRATVALDDIRYLECEESSSSPASAQELSCPHFLPFTTTSNYSKISKLTIIFFGITGVITIFIIIVITIIIILILQYYRRVRGADTRDAANSPSDTSVGQTRSEIPGQTYAQVETAGGVTSSRSHNPFYGEFRFDAEGYLTIRRNERSRNPQEAQSRPFTSRRETKREIETNESDYGLIWEHRRVPSKSAENVLYESASRDTKF
ncbi:MAM and LDL-receptor class A domain-containing protein 1-like isoform X3 [Corticium candelabrum]|nr:MAM and LDL-receptor class A domain-containing protein 1-like isoform X3 [Corticium candelabrum]